ncbi:hypothetical protein DFQ28_003878 [Apophysomyces sp. BC1034]|nr:hypothetical protein DFQ30_003921 [Apophysomyces sp. BC1015]KAG0178664.1 hypothetical protein DFQ29_003137 [Apophysomyces sp. BC1021]KAG0189108.1 hypothetical protein DFQ28_003878 [Apophysomyces sp. BC1034]
MNQDDLESMTQQVHELCSSRRLSEIRIDLLKTKSVEATLNRIWDGGFLEGTVRDPSLNAHIILDSDDEVDDLTIVDRPRTRSPSPSYPTEITDTTVAPLSPILSPIVPRSQTPLPVNPYDSDNDSMPSASQLMNQIYSAERKQKSSQPNNIVICLDDSDVEIPVPSPPRQPPPSPPPPSSSSSPKFDMDYLKQWDNFDIDLDSDVEVVQRDESPKKARSKQSKEEKALLRKEQQEEKKRERERRKAEKEAEKTRKRLFEQANKLRNNRQDMLAEMIVNLDHEFAESTRGQLLRATLVSKEAKLNLVEESLPYTITWQRKCSAEWDGDSQSFIPCEAQIKDEAFVLIFMDMKKMCDLMEVRSLDAYVDQVQAGAGERQVILMLEGLEEYYKARTRLIRRRFESTVLNSLQESEGSAASGSSRKRPRKMTMSTLAETGPSREAVEETLTYLQVVKDIMVIPTENEEKTVEWITNLTMDMGHAPYKNRNLFKGQGPAKCGVDAADTWLKMLEEIQLCTTNVAKSITENHTSLQSLFRQYEAISDVTEAEELLAGISVERNALSARDRTVNKAMSKKIYTIFMTDDPTHVIA